MNSKLNEIRIFFWKVPKIESTDLTVFLGNDFGDFFRRSFNKNGV